MKILLVYPTHLDEAGKPAKYRYFFMPSLAMAQVAALSSGHEVTVLNDAIQDIRPYISQAKDIDLVGISGRSLQGGRMYQIADAFRAQGTQVVLGGLHVTIFSDEAKRHGTVVIGEAENIWSEVLADAEKGKLKNVYEGEPWDMQQLIIPRWDLFDLDLYFGPPAFRLPVVMPIFTTRGCPLNCRYCSVSSIFGKTYRSKPISNVLQEIDAVEANHFFFVDDRIFAQPDYSRELFKALIGKGIRWFGQASPTMLKHPELIELAGKSGCFSLYLGVESINKDALTAMHRFDEVHLYPELFERLYRANIIPYASMIFGFDTDTPNTFSETLVFLKQNYILNCAMWLLTLSPSPEFYKDRAFYENIADRILIKPWSYYDGTHVVIRPKNIGPKNLEKLYWSTFRNFYQICKESTNKEIREVYPMLTDETYWIAMFYQQFGYAQVKAKLSSIGLYSERIPSSD